MDIFITYMLYILFLEKKGGGGGGIYGRTSLTKQTDAGNGPRTPLRKKRLTTTQKHITILSPNSTPGTREGKPSLLNYRRSTAAISG